MEHDVRKETDVPAVVVNQGGTIIVVNAAFEAVFGWSRQEIFGRPLTAIIPPSLHEAHRFGFSRFLATGVATLLNRPITLKAIAKDGRTFDAEHTITAKQQHGQWVFTATVRPVKAPTAQ